MKGNDIEFGAGLLGDRLDDQIDELAVTIDRDDEIVAHHGLPRDEGLLHRSLVVRVGGHEMPYHLGGTNRYGGPSPVVRLSKSAIS